MKKSDFIFAGIVFLISLAVFALFHIGKREGGIVQVYHRGELIGVYSLEENLNHEFLLEEGCNTLTVEGGKAWISRADCPDKLCMKQGKISKQGQSVICLPHRLTVVIECGEEDAIDAVVG